MTDLPQFNPVGRFTGLADLYAKYRPGYPAQAIDWIVAHGGLGPDSVMVDVGSGTGISTRLFARRGIQVIGIEPNGHMRARAEAEPLPASLPTPIYRAGRAEQTGLLDSQADVVLAAQAFHWCEPEPTLREFHRILKLNGWVILLWNEHEERDPFTSAYDAVIRTAPEAPAMKLWDRAGETLLRSPLFQEGQRAVFPNEQQLNEQQLLGRAFSASYAPRQPDQAAVFTAALRTVFGHFQENGTVVLRYQTVLYAARRKS